MELKKSQFQLWQWLSLQHNSNYTFANSSKDYQTHISFQQVQSLSLDNIWQ